MISVWESSTELPIMNCIARQANDGEEEEEEDRMGEEMERRGEASRQVVGGIETIQ